MDGEGGEGGEEGGGEDAGEVAVLVVDLALAVGLGGDGCCGGTGGGAGGWGCACGLGGAGGRAAAETVRVVVLVRGGCGGGFWVGEADGEVEPVELGLIVEVVKRCWVGDGDGVGVVEVGEHAVDALAEDGEV